MTQLNKISVDEILKTKSFTDFLDAAKHFCSFIETQQSDIPDEFLLSIQNHLLKLYYLGLDLPSVILETDTDFNVELPEAEIKALLLFIGKRVPFSYYWTVLNPVEIANPAETGTGNLIDDLGDIYKDLKEGLILFDRVDAGAKENAIFQFKLGFETHWGEHCIEALNAIHHYFAR